MKMATVYCLECEHKLCLDCEECHKIRHQKVTRRHKTVELGSESLPLKLPLNTCEKHVQISMEVFCFDSKLVICMICCINTHSKHICSGMNEIAGELQEQMASDVDKITAGVDQCREMLTKIEKEKNDFTEQIAKVETEVNEKARQLKLMIDNHREKLINELLAMKQERMKEIEGLREEIERQLLSIESYKKYVDELRQKGSASDIASAVIGLQLLLDIIECKLGDLDHADVTLTSPDLVIDDANKTIGQLGLHIAYTG